MLIIDRDSTILTTVYVRMYNNLVETCFNRCVMTGWGGVSYNDHHDGTKVIICPLTLCVEFVLLLMTFLGYNFLYPYTGNLIFFHIAEFFLETFVRW